MTVLAAMVFAESADAGALPPLRFLLAVGLGFGRSGEPAAPRRPGRARGSASRGATGAGTGCGFPGESRGARPSGRYVR